MILESLIDPPTFVFGFGVALFVSLVFLLRWQHRRQMQQHNRLSKGLRNYVSSAKGAEESATREEEFA